MVLPSACTLSPQARLTMSSVAHRTPALPSLVQRHRNQQQTRDFGFGWWAGRFDREQQREFRRRYQQAVLRRAMLDQQARSDAPSCGFKRGRGNTDGQAKRGFAFGRDWRDGVSASSSSRGKPSANFVEDMHCGDWRRMVFRQSSPFYEMRGFIARRQSEILRDMEKASAVQPEADVDYVIDPITNRKVSKASSRSSPDDSVDVPNSAFQPRLRSSSYAGATLDADLPPTPAELRAYRKLPIDDKHEPDLSSISNSGDANYMSWKYTGVFNGRSSSSNGVSKKYNDLDKYKPIDDDASAAVPESSETEAPYSDLAKYKPVHYNEPDGKPSGYVAEETYSDLGDYKPLKHNEPDGKLPSMEVGESNYDPEELAKYNQPVRHNEPDGKPLGYSEATNTYSQSELSKYAPFKWNEPDGQGPTAATGPKTFTAADEVMKNRAVKESNTVRPSLREAMSKPEDFGYDPAEVVKYQGIYWNEPDGQPTTPPVELGHHGYDQAEVQQYQAVKWNEPDGQPTEPPIELGHRGYDQAEVQKYQAYRWNEPDGKPTKPPVELGHHGYDPAEVQQYKAYRWNEPDGQPTTSGELGHLSYDPAEVQKYKAFRHNEPDGKPTAADESALAAGAAGQQKKQDRAKLESAMERMNAEADVIDKIASLSVMTAKKSTLSECLTQAQRQQAERDPYSTKPQGLETSYQEELGMASQPLLVKNYRSKTTKPEPTCGAVGAPTATHTMYITLAWDPARKTVDMSHTTSMVNDSVAALTTNEALKKLTQPNKFLPHLQPLEAQGFEVVTATEDMLVFRQRQKQEIVNTATATVTAAATSPPRFKSNINVRREEPVFSGPKEDKANLDGKASVKKVPHVAKRMVVGATWVAGVSYLLGLAGEQLK